MTYPAIWRTQEIVDSSSLLDEFEATFLSKVSPVLSDNDGWNGVTVFNGADINLLNQLPVLKGVLNKLAKDAVVGVTYFNLSPHSELHRHRDMNGNLLFGIIRLHIPIKTNFEALMEVQKKSYHLPLNSVWALDTSGLHALKNTSDQNRIHIVVDIKRAKSTSLFFPNWSLTVIFHLCSFVFIMVGKIVRDLFKQPKSLLKRITTAMHLLSKPKRDRSQ